MSIIRRQSLLILLLLFCCVICDEEDDYGPEPVPADQWVDPDNMVDPQTDKSRAEKGFFSSLYTTTMDKIRTKPPDGKLSDMAADITSALKADLQECSQRLTAVNQQLKAKEPSACDVPHLKQFVRRVLESATELGPKVIMEIHDKERELLERFLNDQENVHDASEILIKSIENVNRSSSTFGKSYELFNAYLNRANVIAFIMISLVILSVIVFEVITPLSAWRQFLYLMVLSIPWEWYRLYKVQFASKQVEMMKKLPKQCRPDHELGPLESVSLWWRGTFTLSDDPCVKYQEALLVDPLWEVAPSTAVATTITKFFMQPLEYIAEAFGKSFRILFKHVPLQWQPLIFLAGLIIIILIILLMSGVQVNLPFLHVGVGRGPNAVANVNLQQLENKVQELTGTIQQMNEQNVPAIRHVEEVDNIENRLQELTGIVQELNNRNRVPPALMNADEADNRNDGMRQIEALARAADERNEQQEAQLEAIQEQLRQMTPARAEPVEHHEWEVVPPGPPGEEEEEEEERARFFPPVQDSGTPSSHTIELVGPRHE